MEISSGVGCSLALLLARGHCTHGIKNPGELSLDCLNGLKKAVREGTGGGEQNQGDPLGEGHSPR